MAINREKVLIGGFVAGIVLNVIDYLSYHVILGARMTAEANAFKAGLGDQMADMGGGQLATYLLMYFIVGFLVVWMYAAVRPRFGAGPKTAAYVAIAFWVFGLITTASYMQMGIMSSGLWWTSGCLWLVALLLAAVAGAALYSEEGATA